MKPLYTNPEFENAKGKDKLPFECKQCKSTFFINKKLIQIKLKGNNLKHRTFDFCNNKCKRLYHVQDVICKNCGKPFQKIKGNCKTSNNHFCTQSCAGTYNTKNRQRKPWNDEQRKNLSNIRKLINIKMPSRKGCTNSNYKHQKEMKCTNCGISFISHRVSNRQSNFRTTCSDSCYLAVKHKNARGTKGSTYNGFTFDSKWEVELAQFLDKNNIKWVQPKSAILWLDNTNKQHRYYPDFYLPTFNIYLDPKNPICMEQQKEKLQTVTKIINLIYGDIELIKDQIMVRLVGVKPTYA